MSDILKKSAAKLREFSRWTDKQFIAAARQMKLNPKSRIIGVFFEADLAATAGPGGEGVIFYGVDTVTGDRVIAHYLGGTFGASLTPLPLPGLQKGHVSNSL